MKSFTVTLLVFLFAIFHATDGATRGSTTTSLDIEELKSNAVFVEPRKLKGGDKKGAPNPVQQPAVVAPKVECAGCCCSMKDSVTKCCGLGCANKISCLV